MSPKSSIASLGLLFVLLVAGGAMAEEPGSGEVKAPPRRGLPLEVERGGRLPETRLPGAPPRSPEREGIEALSLDLGPVPREVVLDEAASSATWRQAAALRDTRILLHLPRGNMIRPALLARLRAQRAPGLWMTAPLLPIHLEQLEELPGLSELVLEVEAGEDEAALRAVGRLPPLQLRVWLRGPVDAARLAVWARHRRAHLLVSLEPGAAGEALLEALGEVPAPVRRRLVLRIARPDAAALQEAVAGVGAGEIRLGGEGGLPAREILEGLAGAAPTLRVRLGAPLFAAQLVALADLPGLRLELWLSGSSRREARRALQLLGRSLGDRKPR